MKKFLIYILLSFHVFFAGNVGVVLNDYFSIAKAEIGDIGHWRDSIGGQIPGTTFGAFNFNDEIRNDGIYSKPDDSTIELNEAGDYLIIATTRDNDTSNGRYNSQLRVTQTVGSGEIFTSHYSGFSRNTAEDESWTRAVSIIIGASTNSQLQVQKRRDTDAPTGGSVINASDIQVIRLTQTNYGIYTIGGTGNAYGGTTPNTVSIDTVINESDSSAIEGNTIGDTITLKGDNKKYLVAWSASFTGGGGRTQRIGHLEYNNIDNLASRSYCYQRNAANEYCGLGSMDLIETSTADISVQAEIFRGSGVGADAGGANGNGNATSDGNGQMIILEMPDYLEAFSSEDSSGLQNVTSAQTLNFARDVNISDNLSFTKTTNSLINITNPADIFGWGNIWTARNNVASGVRQTTFASIVIDGIEQTTGRHGNYSRGNQGSADTFAMGFHPAGVFTTSGAGGTLEINTTPLPGGGGGGTDRTQPGTVGFFALNLDTLISPELNQSAYRFFDNNNNVDVGSALANQDTSITLSNDGDAFRLRSLISITQNKLRQNEKTFKLQFAQQSGVCDSGFIGETYNDVTTTTAIAFNNNITPSDEDILISNINDPVNTGITAINQTYQELNNFSTSISEIPEDQDGKWDFSLIDNTAPNNTSYCFRIVESDGTLLDSYSVIPEITTYIPPSPGGVSTGLNLWLKSNAGTSTTTDGVNLASWTDQSGNGKTATAVTAPIYRDNATDNVNFYPVVNFNGTNQAMENTTGGMSSKSYFAVIIPTDTIDGTLSGGVPFGLECTNATVDFGTCGLPFGGLVLGSFTVAIPDEVITHALGSSANYRSAETGAESYAADKPMLVMINEDATGTIANIYEKGERLDNFTFNSYQSVTNTNYSLGRSLDGANPFYYDGDVVEIINFDDRLVDADRIKIESYLSLKYGITLKDGTQDYIASDGSTIIWDSGIAGTYNNDIFGIGRDNVQSLEQVQATSINDGTILTITAVGEGTNMSPSFVDIIDKEFFTIGNNAGANTWSATDTPAGFNVIARKWQTQENGDTGSTTFEFDVDDTNFDIPVLTAGTNYYFVYDSDGDSTLADETPVSMTNTSGSLWSTNLNLADETVFTIASEASSNNIPTDITLSNNTINENSIANTVVGSLTTTDGDVSDTHTYSLAIGTGDDDNARFTISGSNLEINHSPDHEIQDSYSIRIQTDDGNGGQYQEIFNIIINDLGEANTTTIDLEDSEDDFKYSVTSGQWNNNAVNPFAGSNSLESDNLGADNTQSCFEVDHNSSSTGSIDFYYEVSSQAGSDELRFFIDNVQQDQWSGTVTYTQYTSGDVSAGPHNYKWCYVKDGGGSAGTDNAYIDNINFIGTATDIIDPTIDSTNFASGSLLPGGNQTINLTYNDTDSGINVASANITLHKWDGISAYGADISGTGLTSGIINSTSATYTTNNLDFGKYQYRFSISDNAGNTQNQNIDFYIDVPEFIISTPEIDMGTLDSISNNFSPTVTITVRTVGAGFDIFMDADDSLLYTSESIDNWNGSTGFGYDQDPYTGNISAIGINQNISTQAASLNTNGDRNIYTFNIQLGGLVSDEQAAGDYLGDIDFGINLAY